MGERTPDSPLLLLGLAIVEAKRTWSHCVHILNRGLSRPWALAPLQVHVPPFTGARLWELRASEHEEETHLSAEFGIAGHLMS